MQFDFEWWHWLMMGGGAAMLLGVVSYSGTNLKVPGIVAGILGGLAVGVGIGIVIMMSFGWDLRGQKVITATPPMTPGGNPGGAPAGDKPGTKGGPRGPDAKTQLAGLVDQLELLTRPQGITLTEVERKGIRNALEGLDPKGELSDDDAKTRLTALADALKNHQESLEQAGFRWPGSQPAQLTNSFHAEHLKALQERLAKPAPK
jgi:hypothetical protein